MPLTLPGGLGGALDLYFVSPVIAAYSTVTDATAVAREINAMLAYAASPEGNRPWWGTSEMPAWMSGPPAQQRLRVWVAVGILMSGFSIPAVNALARTRAYAYGHSQNLDRVIDAIINGRIDPQDLA